MENNESWSDPWYLYGVGDDDKVYPIDLYTMAFVFYPSVDSEGSNANSIFTGDIRTRKAAIIFLHNWCFQNVGKWMKIDEPRSIAPSRNIRSFFTSDPVPFRERSAYCMGAALAMTVPSKRSWHSAILIFMPSAARYQTKQSMLNSMTFISSNTFGRRPR